MKKRVCGVALIVQNPHGGILILQEFKSKPRIGKCSGMFSIPMETSQDGESDTETLERLKREELLGMTIPKKHAYVGRYEVVKDIWVTLYATSTLQGILPHLPDNKGEVGNHRWMEPEKALSLWLRQGAKEMIEDYMKGLKNSVRKCGKVSPTE